MKDDWETDIIIPVILLCPLNDQQQHALNNSNDFGQFSVAGVAERKIFMQTLMSVIQTQTLLAWITIVTVTVDLGKLQLPS